jgi:Rab5 GDP/GTP exchange factor
VGGVSRTPTPYLNIAGMQEEIDREYENATAAAKETLRQIFPSMDVEVIE